MDYWKNLKGKLSQWKDGEERAKGKGKRSGKGQSSGSPSFHKRHAPSQQYSPIHSTTTRSNVKKSPKKSSRFTKASPILKHKDFMDLCQAAIDEASDVRTPVASNSPKTAVGKASDMGTPIDLESPKIIVDEASELSESDNIESFYAESIKLLMSEIYRDIHTASAPGLNTVFPKVPAKQVLESKLKESMPWIRSSLWLDLAIRNRVIGYALIWHTVPHHDISGNFQASVEKIQTGTDDRHHRARGMVFYEERQCRRYGEFATNNGWMMLSILAISPCFRDNARSLDDDVWNLLCNSIFENFDSLELFAKVRHLDWETALINHKEYESIIAPNLMEAVPEPISLDSLHGYVVRKGSDELERPNYQGKFHIDIQNNLYKHNAFRGVGKPPAWPSYLRYPSDPTTVLLDLCDICRLSLCDCEPLDSDAVTKPLVELKKYDPKGTGVRALEPIRQGDILGEYSGQIIPANTTDPKYVDNVYSYHFAPPGHFDTSAMISSKLYGNWTRYISHSCNANTGFKLMTIGKRYRVMIVATRNINVFEEVTVDYGPCYFGPHLQCLCSEQCCKYRFESN